MDSSQDVFEELQRAASEFGVPRLAGLMGVHRGTLFNKLSNKDATSHHKPTLADFIQITAHSKNLQPLKALNSLFNCITYQLPDMSNVSDAALLDLVNKIYDEGGNVHRTMSEALEDGIVTPSEYKSFERDVHEWIAAILELRARFKGLVIHAPE
ncbi:phage regulatory CII family protein [Paludibacterium denitrificans]|nr:phage regulatory CII family protein [Paludibacterium denitrificans]